MLRGKPVYDVMRTELMAGQYLDLLEQAMGGGSADRAMRVVRYKSAKYTIERPLHLGAALAGAPTELVDTYSGYGLPLGEAFQLRDDVLGVFGDPEQTGKPAGDDLREGKRTVLVATAVERRVPGAGRRAAPSARRPRARRRRRRGAARDHRGDRRARPRRGAHRGAAPAQAFRALESAARSQEPAREVLRGLAIAATHARSDRGSAREADAAASP